MPSSPLSPKLLPFLLTYEPPIAFNSPNYHTNWQAAWISDFGCLAAQRTWDTQSSTTAPSSSAPAKGFSRRQRSSPTMPTRWLQLHVRSVAKSLGTFLVARLSQYSWAYECKQTNSDLDLEVDRYRECVPTREPPRFLRLSRGSILIIRFQQASSYDHYRQAITRLEKSLTFIPSEHPLVPRDSQERTACSDAEGCIPTTEQASPSCFQTPLLPTCHDGYRDTSYTTGGRYPSRVDGSDGIPALAPLKILPGHPDELDDVLRTLAHVCARAEFHYTDKVADLENPIS